MLYRSPIRAKPHRTTLHSDSINALRCSSPSPVINREGDGYIGWYEWGEVEEVRGGETERERVIYWMKKGGRFEGSHTVLLK